MKKLFLLCPILIVLITFNTSCKKDKNGSSNEPAPIVNIPPSKSSIEINGVIELPAGSNINLSNLKVFSPVDKSTLSGTKYTIDTISNFSTELLTNSEGEIFLMGYNYPGETDNTIDIKSTALAMVMNMPFALSLNAEGKVQLISKLKASNKLEILINEISKSLTVGKPITDITNDGLIKSLADLALEITDNSTDKGYSISGLENTTIASYRPVPVKINKAGRVLSFESNRVASAFAVGVYMEGKIDKSFTIPGTKLFATSVTDLYKGIFGSGYTEPFQQLYTLDPEKSYDIKIRSGKPGIYDTSNEFKSAMLANAKEIVETVFLTYLPQIADVNKSCVGSFKAKLSVAVNETLQILKGTNQGELGSTVIEIVLKALNVASDAFVDCQVESSYFKSISKLFSISSQVFKIANNANTTVQVYDWFNSRPSIDTCFMVANNQIINCPDPYKMEIVSGQDQDGEFEKKLSKPLQIKILDKNDKVLEGVKVTWKVKSGGGTLSGVESISDANGIAQIEWTLGKDGDQIVEATAKKRDGSFVQNAPITFQSGNPWIKLITGTWTLEMYVVANSEDYSILVKQYNDNLQYNPCGMGYTLLGNNTYIMGVPNSKLTFTFTSDLKYTYVDDLLNGGTCEKTVSNYKGTWAVSNDYMSGILGGNGYWADQRYYLLTGRLEKIDNNTIKILNGKSSINCSRCVDVYSIMKRK